MTGKILPLLYASLQLLLSLPTFKTHIRHSESSGMLSEVSGDYGKNSRDIAR